MNIINKFYELAQQRFAIPFQSNLDFESMFLKTFFIWGRIKFHPLFTN